MQETGGGDGANRGVAAVEAGAPSTLVELLNSIPRWTGKSKGTSGHRHEQPQSVEPKLV